MEGTNTWMLLENMPLVVVCGLPSSGKSQHTRVTSGTGEGRMVYVVDNASVLGAQDSTV